jgi:hypothetical protein
MALLADSPALNAGDPGQLGRPDQRGVVRSGGVNIGAYQATATQLTVAGFPSPTAPGASHTFTVSATDPFGQPALDVNGPVTFSSSDPSATLPAGQSLVGGQGSFNATLNTPGVQSIAALAGGLSGSQTGITVSGPAATATYLSQDATTQGNWMGTYGAQGYDVIDDASSLPSYASITPSGQSNYVWAASTGDPRALQTADGSSRIAACWYSGDSGGTSFSVDVNLTDGQKHHLELYFLDWDNLGRSEQVQISDAGSGAVLSTQPVSSFQSGVYLDYAVSGNVVITITKLAGKNAVLSGLFLDPTTTATFLRQDATTQGTWMGTYGAQGYDVIDDSSSLPGYATVTPSGQSNYVWAASTGDPRALQTADGSSRIAACWYSGDSGGTSFSVDVNLTDGQKHNLELYFLDWDNLGRSEQVQISDAGSGAVLSTQTVSSFQSGVYLDYAVSGNLVIAITRLAGKNAVLSGLFLG